MLKLILKSLLFQGNYRNLEKPKELLNVWFWVLSLLCFYFFSWIQPSSASPVVQDPCPPVPLHPALLCQVICQDVVEVSPPSSDSLLSALCSSSSPPCHLSHNLCLLCRMLLNIFLHVPSPLLHLPLHLLLSLLPPVSLSLVSSQEAVEHFLPPGLQEGGQV